MDSRIVDIIDSDDPRDMVPRSVIAKFAQRTGWALETRKGNQCSEAVRVMFTGGFPFLIYPCPIFEVFTDHPKNAYT